MMQIDSSAVATINNNLADILNADNLDAAKEQALEVVNLIDSEVKHHRTTCFRTGPDEDRDNVPVEKLLMKPMPETVINKRMRYIESAEANDGMRPDDMEAPNDWAITGLNSGISEVSHALKCGCWGYRSAHMR